MRILAIDTSCDETSAAVTEGTTVLSNVIWSQASAHAEFGGVMPSLALRMHQERIDWVVNQALRQAQCKQFDLGAIAVTLGPGLAIALGVGINKAKELAGDLKVPLYGVNHIEGHLLSPLAEPVTKQFTKFKLQNSKNIRFPALGLAISGGHTELVYIEKIGKYKILAQTQDDALGEALDKAARMLGLGYPGGAILEKFAREGNPKGYPLPLPMAKQSDRYEFSYSGLKTAFLRLTQSVIVNSKSKQVVYDLAAAFQNRAFQHLTRVIENTIRGNKIDGIKDLLVGGGVAANMEVRKRLRRLGRELNLRVWFPYSMKLVGDNAAMIGIVAGLRKLDKSIEPDRRARWSVEDI